MSEQLDRMTARFAQNGEVRWIGIRPERHSPVDDRQTVRIDETGLNGDRRTTPGKRAVTLIQWEHLPVIAALSGHEWVDPALLRRNLAISGINLTALRKARFQVGTVILQGTGVCAPCTRMEQALGDGGFNAMRGHGGITAEVVQPGDVSVGDTLTAIL